MLPKGHILLGAIFIAIVWIFIPQMPIFYLALIFLASFLIDFDHYANAVFKTKNISLKNALDYHKKARENEIMEIKQGVRKKSDFHLFHTVEFHAMIGLLSFLWVGFFYIFMGMIFHSLLDVFSLLSTGIFYRREFFFFNWARGKSKGS
ncbi:MAG: hypothetical protein ABIH92_02295 [Nanoarchaeota archaeon]